MRFHDFTTFFPAFVVVELFYTFLFYLSQAFNHQWSRSQSFFCFCWSFSFLHGIHFLPLVLRSFFFFCSMWLRKPLLLLCPHLITILILVRLFTRKSVKYIKSQMVHLLMGGCVRDLCGWLFGVFTLKVFPCLNDCNQGRASYVNYVIHLT